MITLQGVVSKVQWSNPHVHIYVDVKDESGRARDNSTRASRFQVIKDGTMYNFGGAGEFQRVR